MVHQNTKTYCKEKSVCWSPLLDEQKTSNFFKKEREGIEGVAGQSISWMECNSNTGVYSLIDESGNK